MVLCKFSLIVLGFMLCKMVVLAKSGAKTNDMATNTIDSIVIKKVEKSLLSSFGLKEKPNVDVAQVHVPPYMLHLYNLQKAVNSQEAYEEHSNSISEVDTDLLSNTVRSYTHQEISDDDHLNPTSKMVLRFNISGIPENEIIRAVELRISHDAHTSSAFQYPFPVESQMGFHRKLTKKDFKYLQRLRIYDILHPDRNENGPVHRLLDTTVVDSRISGTVKFDVSPAVMRWLKNENKNYGLFLEVTPLKNEVVHRQEHLHIRLKRHAPTNQYSLQQQEPILLVHSDDGTAKPREKRNSKSAYKRYGQQCQRHTLRVDFRKVEWTNWIVAPAGYDAFFCQGECHFPLAEHMNATNHAVVQTLVHSKYPSRVPSACCVPIVHTAISMLYVDEDERVVLKNYQDMVVEACGCR